MFAASDAYEQFMGRWSRVLAPLLIKFAGVSDGHDVLEVGTGTGALALAILELPFTSFDDYAASLAEPERGALAERLQRRLTGSRSDAPFTLRARAWAVKGTIRL